MTTKTEWLQLLEIAKEARECLGAFMRVAEKYGMIDDVIAAAHGAGVRPGVGVRLQAAIDAAGRLVKEATG